MATVTILHPSDLHYRTEQATNCSIIKEALIEDLERLDQQSVNPDLVLFSGDLVFAGENPETFTELNEKFLAPVLAKLKLGSDKLFIAPGNHDISRKQVRSLKYVDDGLRNNLVTVDQINEFIDQTIANPTQNTVALDRLSSFESFQHGLGVKPITANPFVRTYLLPVAGATIGIGCFNTAWRATGEPDDVDRGHLILGERAVDIAIADLAEAKLRLAVFHHPAFWLLDCDSSAVEARLAARFDILCMGHIHESRPHLTIYPTGTCMVSQAGCLYQARKYFNGYQILRITLETGEVEIFVRSYYDNPRRTFDAALAVYPQGYRKFQLEPRANTPQAARVEEVLRSIRPYIREKANEHFSMVRGTDPRLHDIRTLFQVPPLGIRPEMQINYKTGDKKDKYYRNLEDMLQSGSNIIFFGRRDAGKTSLAHFIATKVSEGLSDRPRVPIIFDAENFGRTRDVRHLVRPYLSDFDKYNDIKTVIETCDLLIIVDEFLLGDRFQLAALERFRRDVPSIRWICLIDEDPADFARSPELPASIKDFERLFIHSLPRRAIRKISPNLVRGNRRRRGEGI
jgi:predicted MPP superfamily phosphohydrolase